jgi:hypothetical protein
MQTKDATTTPGWRIVDSPSNPCADTIREGPTSQVSPPPPQSAQTTAPSLSWSSLLLVAGLVDAIPLESSRASDSPGPQPSLRRPCPFPFPFPSSTSSLHLDRTCGRGWVLLLPVREAGHPLFRFLSPTVVSFGSFPASPHARTASLSGRIPGTVSMFAQSSGRQEPVRGPHAACLGGCPARTMPAWARPDTPTLL